MPNFPTGRDALTALVAFLNQQLKTTHAGEFARYRDGARCFLSDELPPDPSDAAPKIEGPFAVLRLERDEMRPMGLVATVYDCRIRVEVKASELSGGKRAEPQRADSLLSRVLNKIVSDNEQALRDAGFRGLHMEGGSEQTRAVRGAAQENNDSHRILFWYVRPQ